MTTELTAFRPGKRELTELVRLALPVVTVQVGTMAMGTVDTIMVGHLSAEALAAVAIGNVYFYGTSIFAMGVLMVLDPIVSQAVGAGDRTAIARAVQRGVLISLVLSAVLSLPLAFADPVLRLARQQPELVPMIATYCRIMIPGMLPLLFYTVLRQSLQAMMRLRAILIAILIANVCNLFLNWVLIYGHFGIPPMGVAGSALATTISRFVGCVLVLAIAWRELRPLLLPFDRNALEWAPLARMLRLGGPIGVHHLLEFSVFGLVSFMMGALGTIQIASHQIAINLASLTFMVPLGIAQAGGVLVGQAVGRGDESAARRAAGAALVGGAGFMATAALLFLVLPTTLARAYTTDAAVLTLATVLVRIAGVFQVFDGLQVVGTGVLRGIGDTRVPMLAGLVGFWLIGMPVSASLAFRAGLGAIGLWWGFVAGLAAVAIFLLARIRYRFARSLVRLHIEVPVAQV